MGEPVIIHVVSDRSTEGRSASGTPNAVQIVIRNSSYQDDSERVSNGDMCNMLLSLFCLMVSIGCLIPQCVASSFDMNDKAFIFFLLGLFGIICSCTYCWWWWCSRWCCSAKHNLVV